jgi:hypothetical protein
MNHVARKASSSRVKLRNLKKDSAIKIDIPNSGIVSRTILLIEKDAKENTSVFASDNDRRPLFLRAVLPRSSFILLHRKATIYVYKYLELRYRTRLYSNLINKYVLGINQHYNMSASLPIKYYTRKYGDDTCAAFIHLVREIGQVAFAIETKNDPVLEAKLTEAVALLGFIAHSHKMDLGSNTERMYSKKLSLSERKHE